MSQESSAKKWVIYGSYGYTGRLISELISEKDLDVRPVLAGRNEKKLKEQAAELGLDYMAANLEDPLQMDNLLNNAELVIHCAGPFRNTWEKMLESCIRNRCHYLDITGEIEVFEGVKSKSKEIEAAKIMAMPGTGFDVVPTDCMALFLKKQMPDATEIELAFMGLGGGVSHGTAQTMAENMGNGGAIRKDGEITSVPAAYKTREIDFGKGVKTTASIPWGDVSTAHFTTGIENIVVYTAMKKSQIRWLKISNWIAPILRLSFVRSLIKKRISKNVKGPGKKSREKGVSVIWGEVKNGAGQSIQTRCLTLEGYRLTAITSLLIAEKIRGGEWKPGYQTPASVYGEDLILEVDRTTREVISEK